MGNKKAPHLIYSHVQLFFRAMIDQVGTHRERARERERKGESERAKEQKSKRAKERESERARERECDRMYLFLSD